MGSALTSNAVSRLSAADRTAPAARRLLMLLVLVYVLHMLDRQIIAILLEPLRHAFALKDSQLGLLSGLAYSGAAILTGVPAGMLADRFSRKRVLIASLVLWSGFTALCGVASGYPMLLLARMGVGTAESGGPPAALSMLTDAFPEKRRGQAAAIFYSSGGIGTILSFTIGAWIAVTWGWRFAFFFAAIPGLLLSLLLCAMLREPSRTVQANHPEGRARGAIDALRRAPSLILLIGAMTLASVGPSSLGTWMSSLLVREHGFGLRGAGLIVALSVGVIGPLGQLAGGWIGDRLAASHAGSQFYFVAASGCVGTLVAIAGVLTANDILAIAGLFGGAFAMASFIGPSYAMLMSLSPPGPRGAILAIMTVSGNLAAYGGGPVLVGLISDRIGGLHSLSRALPIALSAPLVSSILFFILARRLRR